MKQVISWDLYMSSNNGISGTNGVLGNTPAKAKQSFVMIQKLDGQREYVVLKENSAIKGKFVDGVFKTYKQLNQERKAERKARLEAKRKAFEERRALKIKAQLEAKALMQKDSHFAMITPNRFSFPVMVMVQGRN